MHDMRQVAKYDAIQVANWFIERGKADNNPISIMGLLKLAYISHGWHLALIDAPLFHNRIEAWTYGPVVRDIYDCFREQGQGITPDAPAAGYAPISDDDDIDFLVQNYKIYGKMPPWSLSKLTHVSGGPWDTVIRVRGKFSEIPNNLIKDHYTGKLEAWNEKQRAAR